MAWTFAVFYPKCSAKQFDPTSVYKEFPLWIFFIVKWSGPPSCRFPSPYLPRLPSAAREEHLDAGTQIDEQAGGHWQHPAARATRNSTRRLREPTSPRLLLVSLHLLLWIDRAKKHCPWVGWKRMSKKFLKLYPASISSCLCKHHKIPYWNWKLLLQHTGIQNKPLSEKLFLQNRVAFAEVIRFKYIKCTDLLLLHADGILFIIWWKVSQRRLRYKESLVF